MVGTEERGITEDRHSLIREVTSENGTFAVCGHIHCSVEYDRPSLV